MTLLERIEKDIPAAMRMKDPVNLETLRSIKTGLEAARHASRGAILTADKEAAVLKTMAKQRLESAEIFKTAGRHELARKEELEFSIIRRYMPEQASREEMVVAVDEVVSEMLADGPVTIKKMGDIMKRVALKLEPRAVDGKIVSELVKSRL